MLKSSPKFVCHQSTQWIASSWFIFLEKVAKFITCEEKKININFLIKEKYYKINQPSKNKKKILEYLTNTWNRLNMWNTANNPGMTLDREKNDIWRSKHQR